MLIYLGSTRDKRFVQEMRAHGIGECWVAGGPAKRPIAKDFMVDNGAYGAWVNKTDWKPQPFLDAIRALDRVPNFIVCPDLPARGNESLVFSMNWVEVVGEKGPVVLAVQDGVSVPMVSRALVKGRFAGLFVGGTTKWKWQTAPLWCRMANEMGLLCHIGRAATPRGIRRALECGATSLDGNQALWSRLHFARMLKAMPRFQTQMHFA